VSVEGEKPLFYGSRCEKYDVIKRTKGSAIPDLFEEREQMLFAPYEGEEKLPPDAPEIGIPRILHFHEMSPFWRAFFTELGYRVVLSDVTHKELIRKRCGECRLRDLFSHQSESRPCPQPLGERGEEDFLPSVVNLKPSHPEIPNSSACPYAQSFPYAIPSSIDFKKSDAKMLQPILHSGSGKNIWRRNLVEFGKSLHRGSKQVKKALEKAERFQALFFQSMLNRGKTALDQVSPKDKVMVIVGRP